MLKGILLTLITLAALGRAQQDKTADPLAGSIKKRVYTSDYFGFSITIPKGWTTQLQTLQRLERMKALKDRAAVVLRHRTMFRNMHVLLSAHPEGIPLEPIAPPPQLRGQGIAFAVKGKEHLTIRAEKLTAAGLAVGTESFARRLRQEKENTHPSLQLSAPHPRSIAGQGFFQFDCVALSDDSKAKPRGFATILVGYRKGYVLEFEFVADSLKALKKQEEMLSTMSFAQTPPERWRAR